MDEIAQNADVTKQTVYRYFPSKETLFSAVMKQTQETWQIPYVFGNNTVTEELTSFAKQLLMFHLKTETLGLYRLMLTEGTLENLGHTFFTSGPQHVLQPLVTYLGQHCDQSSDCVFNAGMFASMVLAPRSQILMGSMTNMKPTALEAHVEKVVRLFLHGIQPRIKFEP